MLLMAASGFAGLGYQIVWTQQCALWLGHEVGRRCWRWWRPSSAAWRWAPLLLGPRIERSARPARWYAACEAVIGVWGLALALA